MLRQELKKINKTEIDYTQLYDNCISLMKQEASLGYTNTVYFIPSKYIHESTEILKYLDKKLKLGGILSKPNFMKKCIHLDWS